jgi:two-component system, NarL family, sensor kinase
MICRFSFLIGLLFLVNFLNAQDKAKNYLKDSLEVVSLLDKAYSLESEAPYKAIEVYKRAAKKSQLIHFNIGSFRSYSYTAIVFNDLAVYDSAIYYNKKALPFAKKANYKKGIAATYINLGNTYQYFGQYDKVVENYQKGIEIFEANTDSVNVSKSYQNLAALFASIEKNDKEIEYLEKSLRSNSNNNQIQNGYVYGDLGLANLRLKKFEQALNYFEEAEEISKNEKDIRLEFFVVNHFGDYHAYKSDYINAIPYYEKSLTIISELNDEFYKADVLFKLGESHSKLKQFAKAESYLNEALVMAKISNTKEIQEKVYLELAFINESLGNFKKAYDYNKLGLKFSDSLKNERFIKQINVLEKQFETKKKDSEIYEQQLLLAKQQKEIDKKQMQKNIAIGLAILFLILSLLSWLIYRQRQKRKNQELLVLKNEAQIHSLESLIEGEEKERFRIAKELHDGVNGDLSAIKHKLNTLLELNNKTIKEAVVMIDKSCEQVRAISHNLVPPALENFDLESAISDYCTNMNNVHAPEITFDYLGDTIHLPKIVEVNIFRITQELVNNCIKHAEASEVNVQLSYRNNTIQLAVDDNGKGFDTLTVKSTGIGLSNVKNRVAFLNGEIDFVSSEKGTSVNILIDTSKINHD